jgi:nonsense-mediated mRNA decay protein 3
VNLYTHVSLTVLIHSLIASVAHCRNCERFLSPPSAWTLARPESAELLSICLKKLKGLNKVRLTDARFIWTEPHSKRLRVAVTIQKEVLFLGIGRAI